MSKKDKDAMLSKAADALEPYLDREENGEAWIYFDDENLKDCLFGSVSDYLKKKRIVYPYDDHNKNVDKANEMLSSYVEHSLGDIGNTKVYNSTLKDKEVKELLYKFDDDYNYMSYSKLNPNSYSFGIEMLDIINFATENGSIYLENDFEEELRKRKVYEYD